MVCDMRNGGKIYADGQLIQENGVFKNSRFPQPTGTKKTSRKTTTRKKTSSKRKSASSSKKKKS
jgi:hypothetical protein